ncbi:MAG: class I SAM-dependent methyltransferase [Candidatus Omnitrophota bacterium]|jgi:2-polyprenyl-3-methyl-5-hydroxy-6-metoxy-1,4-benzoquinol methylase
MQETCPRCKKDSGIVFKTKDVNRKVSGEIFDYRLCFECQLIFLSNIPVDLDAYYGDEYYCPPTVEKVRSVARKEAYQLAMVTAFVKTGRLLEVGPGFGIFAYQAKTAGFDVEVIEKEKKCCEFLRNTIGVKTVQSNSPHTALDSAKNYDVIALWHVIEHLPFPWEFISKAAQKLNDKGVFLIATPNPAAAQFRFQGACWPHVDAPRHLCLIPLELLIKHMKPLGLEPMLVSFNDKGARSWNRFGWQRYLMNRCSSRLFQKLAFCLGYLVALPMNVFDRLKGKSSAYTVVFQKIKP